MLVAAAWIAYALIRHGVCGMTKLILKRFSTQRVCAISGMPKNIVGVPFFMLFDRADVSIPKRLLKEGMRHSYSSYILSSMASHGSSMEEFIDIQSPSIKPLLVGDQEQINMLAPEVIFRCRHLYTLLEIINDEMVKNPQIRV